MIKSADYMFKSIVIQCVLLFCALPFVYGQAYNEAEVSTYTIGERVQFTSDILGEERILNIYLPVDYAPDTVAYHVVYLLDGSAHEDFLHISGLVQFANYPWVNMAPRSIVVGIENVDRYRDFTFAPTKKEFQEEYPDMGKSASFIGFLQDEVVPLVNERYATDGTSTLIGQSLGGLLATELLFTHPDMFSNYIIISPSLWWNDQSLMARHTGIEQARNSHKVFIGVGKEGPVMEKDARDLADLLTSKYADIETHYTYMGGQDHANILHQAVYLAFKSLFVKESEGE